MRCEEDSFVFVALTPMYNYDTSTRDENVIAIGTVELVGFAKLLE